MRKLIIFLLAVTFSLSAFSQIDFKFKGIGGGISLGSKSAIDKNGKEAMGFGLNVNGLAQIMEKIDAEAGFTFYFPSEPVTGLKWSVMSLNFNGHYNFISDDKLTAYGLAGLQIGMWSMEMPGFSLGGFGSIGSFSTDGTEVGFNIGAGGNYAIMDMLDATGQIGYTIGDLDQLYINLGVLYKF